MQDENPQVFAWNFCYLNPEEFTHFHHMFNGYNQDRLEIIIMMWVNVINFSFVMDELI